MSTPSIKNRILEEKFNMAKSKQKTLAAASTCCSWEEAVNKCHLGSEVGGY